MTHSTMRKRNEKSTPWVKLGLTATATQGLYFLMARLAGNSHATTSQLFEQTPSFFALWAGLFVLFAIALSAAKNETGKGVTRFIFITSLAFRVILIPSEGFQVETSTAWMSEPATSPLGRAVRAASRKLGELAELHARSADARVPLKALSAGADLAALALMPGLLKAAGLPPGLSLAHGWNPLAVKESAASGRLVSLGLLLLVITARAVQKGSRRKAAFAYGAGLTAGLWTFASAPALARFSRLTAVLAALLGLAGWMSIGLGNIDFNPVPAVGSSLLPVTVSVAGVLLTRNPLVPPILCYTGWLIFALSRARQRSLRPEELPREILSATGGLMMVLPRVFPWYLVPLAFFSAFSGNRGWIVFTATAPLTYLAYGNGGWSGWSFWLGFVQYFPAYFVLIFDWLGKPKD